MIKVLKVALLVFLGLFTVASASGQITQDNSKWTLEAKKVNGDKYELCLHLKLPDKWHIYSLKPGGDGMELAPVITFKKNSLLALNGVVTEKGKLLKETMEGIDGIVNLFKGKVNYTQQATISGNTKVICNFTYQICDDKMCLPPKDATLTVDIKDAGGNSEVTAAVLPTADSEKQGAKAINVVAVVDSGKDKSPVLAVADVKPAAKSDSGNDLGKQPLWILFFISLGSGLLAIFTPCIFSMIPITISFFTKRSKTRAEGIRNAIWYSLSIIVIFTVLGVLISALFGSDKLNTLSTDWRANLVFFVLILIFAISFLGAFEITLPSSWTGVTDSKAGVGSFMGIFFMALTLVIVSFSCTGPIVGPLLVLAGKGGVAGPIVGMLGFSLGLSLPFALFAIFPGLINKMAQSGGWLNQVKVVLGFVELMLALKFLSNADLAMGWRLLDRELFIAIWIVLSILLGFYLLGKLKLSHDDANAKNVYGQEYVSIFKLFLSITFFTFAVYLMPGMWGAPLNGVSAFVPPMGTFDAFGGSGQTHVAAANNTDPKPVKYVEELKIYEPKMVKDYGLVTFFDYDEALAASRILKKPIMLDFTGVNCANCRKMESKVWSKPEVAKRMKEDFIVVSLYCDMNKIELPADKQYFSSSLNATVKTLGGKNQDLQASKFGSNSMPIYFFVDENGTKLADTGYSYSPDVQLFVDHLDKVKANYKKTHAGS
jgi:thiol:disulfide interchange protein